MTLRETDLAPVATAYLQERGFDVYHEVAPWGGGARRADLVGVRRGPGVTLLHVVELKASYGAAVLDQAIEWSGFAHFVTVVTQRRAKHSVALELARAHYGIGHLAWDPRSKYAEIEASPRLHRRIVQADRVLAACLPDVHHSSAILTAGSSGGGFATAFSRTLRELEATVKVCGRISLREAIAKTPHHYSSHASARAALVHWIRKGKVPGVQLLEEGHFLFLEPTAR